MKTAIFLDELKSSLLEEQLSVGYGDLVTVYPYSEDEISTLLKYANDNQLKVSIIGNGSKSGFGGQQQTDDLLLSLEKYKGVVEHTVGDMTITVKSGTNFQELQDYLAKCKQKLSLDPFSPTEATIGGILAANDSGPKRYKYGSARDSVIGLRTVYPDGTVIRSGGKVVKNVAGYDMNKLFIGSMGTLGVISEVTFKLRPLPKYESIALLSFPEGNAEDIKSFAVQVLDSTLEPVCLEWLNPTISERLTNQRNYTLAIAFEDVESSVHYQEEMLRSMAPTHAKIAVLQEKEAQSFWEKFYEMNRKGSGMKEVTAVLKAGVVNLDVLKVVKEADLLQDLHNIKAEVHGGLGHGLCQITLTGLKEDVAAYIHHIRKSVKALDGYVIIKHLPESLRNEVDFWGEKPSYFFLLEGIKAKVDPNKLLNPNRFVGGI
ncbi:FAD-binding oxidoreductase [Cytobacillus depressus]|uniref:FAD-binding oxidoreductase n=1 Tax=Cytobacillus depressus TaxID=1602942 RepID=A0A6L3VEG5_9BACI|nr:FAD-binding oxidoreductase [Cytobacillus depressus]KAB2338084.1 FAD-binding oxidoreductase [Cytobacillus depressus]